MLAYRFHFKINTQLFTNHTKNILKSVTTKIDMIYKQIKKTHGWVRVSDNSTLKFKLALLQRRVQTHVSGGY